MIDTKDQDFKVILATDVGSTTTKARLFMKKDSVYRFIVAGEAPSTVEAPFEDVTMGVRNACREIEELIDHRILSEGEGGIITPWKEGRGVDLYLTTSSAGGGLQMLCSGVVKNMTAESAERAALGAGAIVMDVLATDDGRKQHEKINLIRNLRPDIFLLAGGTDGGNLTQVVRVAELLSAADLKPRLGTSFELPVVYAGNKNAVKAVCECLDDKFNTVVCKNLRPTIEEENTGPAREAIHDIFMEHVMSHAPGYKKLMGWTQIPIMPTPAAERIMMELVAEVLKGNVLGVGLGGATTNLYSIVGGRSVRTVSANLGMSYSICNVLKEATIANIMRWVPFALDESDIRNRMYNKMIRPTTIPQTMEELVVEHAVAREALRLGLLHHRSLARGLKGVKRERNIGDMFEIEDEESYIKLLKIPLIVGTGGLLSHAPNRAQSMLILNDGFQVEGVTRLFQDSVFMIPHLGLLSTVHKQAAWEVFDRDCLLRLGTVIAPAGALNQGETSITLTLEYEDGDEMTEDIKQGTMKKIPLAEGKMAKATIKPHGNIDIGAGIKQILKTTVYGGICGVVVDTRGRPLELPDDDVERKKKLIEWYTTLDVYPEEFLIKCRETL